MVDPPSLVIYQHHEEDHCAVYLHGELVLAGNPDGFGKVLVDELGMWGVGTVFYEDTYLLGRELGTDGCVADSLEEIAHYCAGEVGRGLRLQEIDREIRRLEDERCRLMDRMETKS